MTFSKAANLLRVADMATSRYDGIRLQDVTDEFGCDHRTAQRMMRAFEGDCCAEAETAAPKTIALVSKIVVRRFLVVMTFLLFR